MLGGSLIAGVTASLPSASFAKEILPSAAIKLEKGMTILFQGDSITDAGRQNRQNPNPTNRHRWGMDMPA